MNAPMIATFVILGASMVLFLSERVPVDLVALLVAVALGLGRLLTPAEALAGFSNGAVITIMAVFVLAGGLESTGVTEQLGRYLLRLSGPSEGRLVLFSMVAAATMSLFMNNIAAATVLLPAVSGAAAKARISPSRVLLPLAFATLLGGMATLFTTTNLVVSGVLQATPYAVVVNGVREVGHLQGFGVFDFAPVGIPIVIAGIAYVSWLGRKTLPRHSTVGERIAGAAPHPHEELLGIYRLQERLFRARVPAGSRLTTCRLGASGLREEFHLTVMTVERGPEVILFPNADTRLQEGDVLLLKGNIEKFMAEDVEPRLEILPAPEYHDVDLESDDVVMVEAMLSPRSGLIGQTLRAAHFRERYGMNVIALWRRNRAVRTGLGDLPLEFGDAMLMRGYRDRLPMLRDDSNLILLSQVEEKAPHVPRRGFLALAIVVVTLLTASLGPFPLAEVMLGGAVVMALTGLVTMEQAYRTIEWRIVFLVAGILPLGTAMTKTGATGLIARALLAAVGPFGPMAVLLALLVVTILLSQTMKGAAVSVVMAPIAIEAAGMLHPAVDPRAFCMGVALATSMAFITPLGHPVNILMLGPGGYKFSDFFKVGLPLTIILLVVVMVLLPILWPFHAVPLMRPGAM